MSSRLASLDWLRGLMALSVMLYHFGGQHDASAPLGRLGIYGVSIFFILSGLSMAIAYDRYISGVGSSVKFFIRRLFRIWPLLWVAVALVAVPTYFYGRGAHGQEPYSVATIFLNITTLFGFVSPAKYINVGAWSIGNEMVYYALTPLFIYVYRVRKAIGDAMVVMTAGVGLLFAFSILSADDNLGGQWDAYINPFNNLFLYCAGLAVYYNFKGVTVPLNWRPLILGSFLLAFFIYPASGDQINLVTGFNRVFMSIVSVGVVFSFYKCAPVLPKIIDRNLERLGVATYGVYLLHPIVMDCVRGVFRILDLHIRYIPTVLAIAVTIVLAFLSYKFFEAPFVNLGKRLTRNDAERLNKSGAAAASEVK